MKPRHLLVLGLLMAALLPSARAEDELALRWSPQAGMRPMFRGVLNKDGAGMGAGQMLYQVPNVAGLFAAILAHATVNSVARDAEMRRLQDKADEVLRPYSAALETLSTDDLLARTRTALQPQGLAARQGWVNANLELTPVFLMTPDRRAVMLDVVALLNDGTGAAPRQLGMRVVSDPRGKPEDKDDWADADSQALKKVCVDLMARAVRHMLDRSDAARQPAAPSVERTVRFVQGGAQHMERSRVLEQRCGRALLLTLSDTLMSVPLAQAAALEPDCAGVAPPALPASAVQ